ncbi:MAG: radical SAM protein [Bacteroidales bacterium]|nr:radical SAM protein [Bacteroidales bacterium]
MKKKTVFVINNSECVRRRLDAAKLENYFKANDLRIANRPKDADYTLFVSCAYTHGKQQECVSVIKKMEKMPGELIVGGCFPEIAPDMFREHFEGRFISTKTIGDIDLLFDYFKIKWCDIPDTNIPQDFIPLHYLNSGIKNDFRYLKNELKKRTGSIQKKAQTIFTQTATDHDEAFLRVGYGCAGRCAYCAIYKAIGKIKSKTIEECVLEYRNLLDNGYRQIVIVSDDIGPYGRDIGTDLPALLEALDAEDNGHEVKWDIRQLAPKWFIAFEEVLKRFISKGKIEQLLCSIQSASEPVLKRMNRHADMLALEQTIRAFREINPQLVVRTEVIVGYPAETREDHNITVDYLLRVRFDQVQLFGYSDVAGTKASVMDNKVRYHEIMKRLKETVQRLEAAGIEWLCPDLLKE